MYAFEYLLNILEYNWCRIEYIMESTSYIIEEVDPNYIMFSYWLPNLIRVISLIVLVDWGLY